MRGNRRWLVASNRNHAYSHSRTLPYRGPRIHALSRTPRTARVAKRGNLYVISRANSRTSPPPPCLAAREVWRSEMWRRASRVASVEHRVIEYRVIEYRTAKMAADRRTARGDATLLGTVKRAVTWRDTRVIREIPLLALRHRGKMGIFFSKKKQPSRVTQQDKAILVSRRLNLLLIALLLKLSNHSLIADRIWLSYELLVTISFAMYWK